MHVRHKHIYLYALIHTSWVHDEDLELLGGPNLIFSPPRLQWWVSLSTSEIAQASGCLTDVYLYCDLDPHCIYHGYDPLIHHGSTVYPSMATIMSTIHFYYTWVWNVLFGSHACFHYQTRVCPPRGLSYMVYTWLYVGSHFLAPWLLLMLHTSNIL